MYNIAAKVIVYKHIIRTTHTSSQLQNHKTDGASRALKPITTPVIGGGLLPIGAQVDGGACDGPFFF